MAPTIQLGSYFKTWEDLKEALDSHADQQQVPYNILCSQLIEGYNEKNQKSLPNHFKYATLTWACIHAGTPRSTGTGQRVNQSTFKMKCPARIRVKVDETKNQFRVTVFSVDHNHDINPEYSDCYPSNRRLTKEEEAQASNLMDLEVRPSILQGVIRTSTGKCPTLQDVRNAQQRRVKTLEQMRKEANGDIETIDGAEVSADAKELLDELENARKSDPEAKIIIGTDQDDEITFVFWASSEMQSNFKSFPEVLSIDNTYNTNKVKMPLTGFLCQDKFGHGKVAAYALIRDEKKTTLQDVFSTFVETYASVKNKIRTVFVDKDMNEILRVREVLPDADVVVCRYHSIEIFKREIGKKFDKDEDKRAKGREITKKMLYTECDEEYAKLYKELKTVASDAFMKYFDDNWHNARVLWKGHERLQSVTFGVTTTNNNESLHGKLKQILNKRRSLGSCFAKLRLYQENDVSRSRMREFNNFAKVPYVCKNTDPTIRDIVSVCTPFVSNLIRQEYSSSLKMDALPGPYNVDTDKCTCAFFRSRGFPCCHMFFSRRLKDCDLFSETDIGDKWKRKQDPGSEADDLNPDDPTDNTSHSHPPPVLVPSNPVKQGGKALTQAQKYNHFLRLCVRAGNLVAQCGGKQYLGRCKVMEDLISSWEKNEEVEVLSNSLENARIANNALHQKASVLMEDSHDNSGETHSQNGLDKQQECNGKENAAEQKDPMQNHSNKVASELKCRCGINAVCHVPKYGPNRGRRLFKCAKTLPEVPCTFSTICHEDLPSPQDVSQEQTQSGSRLPNIAGSKKHHIGLDSKRPTVKLPVPLVVKGQPKTGGQRTFKKTKKFPNVAEKVSKLDKGSEIPNNHVTKCGHHQWTVQSQSKIDTVYVIKKTKEKSDRCMCAEQNKCAHCFNCNCPDNFPPCKHIYKVQAMFAPDDDALSDEDVKPNLVFMRPNETKETVTITILDSDSESELKEDDKGNTAVGNQSTIGGASNSNSGPSQRSQDTNVGVCPCNVKAVQLTVCEEGPHQGRSFYKCGASICDFFMWTDEGQSAPTGGRNFHQATLSNVKPKEDDRQPSQKSITVEVNDDSHSQFEEPVNSHFENSNSDKVRPNKCCVCEREAGEHHCKKCKQVVHAIPPCSTPDSDSEEGFGQQRICSLCEDALSFENDMVSPTGSGYSYNGASAKPKQTDTPKSSAVTKCTRQLSFSSICSICKKPAASVEKCVSCFSFIHGCLPCSIPHFQSGDRRICNSCCVYTKADYESHFPNSVRVQNKNGPYFCSTCAAMLKLKVAENTKTPSKKGHLFYICPGNPGEPMNPKCSSVFFWAPKCAQKEADDTTYIGFHLDNTGDDLIRKTPDPSKAIQEVHVTKKRQGNGEQSGPPSKKGTQQSSQSSQTERRKSNRPNKPKVIFSP